VKALSASSRPVEMMLEEEVLLVILVGDDAGAWRKRYC
jgi:hypothetical protein